MTTPPVEDLDSSAIADLVASEDYARAAALLVRRLDADPGDARAHHNLAVVRYKQGRLSEAADRADRALALDERPLTLYVKALALFEAGDSVGSLASLDRALEMAPSLAGARYQRALAFFRLDRLEEAAADLELAGAWTAADAHLPFNLAIVLAALGREDDGFRAVSRGLELDPAWRRECLAIIYELGRRKAAREGYDQAHRFKNLLALVGARLRELAADFESRSGRGELADMIRLIEDQDRLFADLASYLASMRPSGGSDLEVIDPADLVDGALVALARPKGIALETRSEEGLPEIVCEPGPLREAVFAVLVNAVEAVGGSGKITVTIRRGDAGREAVIEIADTGPGVPAEAREVVFRPGHSTKPLGSGLGLALARRAVETHGGTLDVAPPEPGRTGATFVFTLPTSPAPQSPISQLTLKSRPKEDAAFLLI